MKIEKIGYSFNIFINSSYINNLNFTEKESIIAFVKDILIKNNNILKLSGFYKVKIYPNSIVGIFIEVIRIDDVSLSGDIDFRFSVIFDEPVYYRTSNYSIISKCDSKLFYDDFYYCRVTDKFTDILNKSEFGDYVLRKHLHNILINSIVL